MAKTIYHRHHVTPRHVGGTDDPENIVRLTIIEHAEAHRKLFEEYGRWQDELAWKGLSAVIGKDEIISRVLKEAGKSTRGRKQSIEERKRRSIAQSKEKNWNWGKTTSPETCSRISKSLEKFTYILFFQNGTTETTTNLKKYSREHNYNPANMCDVANGKRKHYKGIKILKFL